MPRSICARCGKFFKSVASFDKHRTGSFRDAVHNTHGKAIGYAPPSNPRRCMDIEEMYAAGMNKNVAGVWIASAYEASAHDHDDEREEERTQ